MQYEDTVNPPPVLSFNHRGILGGRSHLGGFICHQARVNPGNVTHFPTELGQCHEHIGRGPG